MVSEINAYRCYTETRSFRSPCFKRFLSCLTDGSICVVWCEWDFSYKQQVASEVLQTWQWLLAPHNLYVCGRTVCKLLLKVSIVYIRKEKYDLHSWCVVQLNNTSVGEYLKYAVNICTYWFRSWFYCILMPSVVSSSSCNGVAPSLSVKLCLFQADSHRLVSIIFRQRVAIGPEVLC